MRRFLIASHGHLASGMKSAVEILTGPTDAIEAVDAYVDDTDYVPQIRTFIEASREGDESVIFTDILGGSVFQKVMAAEPEKHGVMHVTGTNLAMVIECLITPEALTPARIDEIAQQATLQLKRFSLRGASDSELTGDEDFFD
jgi:PTS system mannose-specific IIA component